MSKPRIIEVPYHEFEKNLQRATDTNKTIEKINQPAWSAFVRRHQIPEAGMAVHAGVGAVSGKLQAVIIDGTGDSDGYYIYSSGDRYCMKYELGTE